jgi:hypothetical protein
MSKPRILQDKAGWRHLAFGYTCCLKFEMIMTFFPYTWTLPDHASPSNRTVSELALSSSSLSYI